MQILSAPHAGAPFTQYIVFTSSGTLTVANGGVVSICTIGGGAGGGFDIGGGGGAAELDLFANFTIAANLSITIGASGAEAPNGTTRSSAGGTSTVIEGVTTHQSALGGGPAGSFGAAVATGQTGGSGGGGSRVGGEAGGGASGSNTFAGGTSIASGAGFIGGGGGGATAVGSSANGSGGQGYALTSIDANLTAANFPTTLTGKTHVSSGGGGGNFNLTGPQLGGTNAGDGGYSLPSPVNATASTSYGCGGGGGVSSTAGTAGFAGAVIIKFTSISGVSASGGQETVNILT